MSADELKPGDRVRVLENGMYGILVAIHGEEGEREQQRTGTYVGATGTVTETNGHAARVRTDAEEPTDPDGNGWAFRKEWLERIDAE